MPEKCIALVASDVLSYCSVRNDIFLHPSVLWRPRPYLLSKIIDQRVEKYHAKFFGKEGGGAVRVALRPTRYVAPSLRTSSFSLVRRIGDAFHR